MLLIPALLVLSTLPLSSALSSVLANNSWSFAEAYPIGLENVSFSYDISKVDPKSGYSFVQQFNFLNNDGIGYVAIEPREDSDGNTIIRTVYKSLIDGSVPAYDNCIDGADGGPGVTCELDVPADFSHKWTVLVDFYGGTGDRYWLCILADNNTGEETYIGEFLLPGEGNIVNGQMGFVEYLPWKNETVHACDCLPALEVTFFDVGSNSASGPSSTEPEEFGDCKGKEAFSVTRVEGGWDIKLGF